MGSTSGSSDICYFCEQRVYLVERHSAEGVFFHRGCLKCEYCGTNLRIGQYCFRREDDGTGTITHSDITTSFGQSLVRTATLPLLTTYAEHNYFKKTRKRDVSEAKKKTCFGFLVPRKTS